MAKIVPDEGRMVFDETWQTLRTESALPRGAMEIKQATRIANAIFVIRGNSLMSKLNAHYL